MSPLELTLTLEEQLRLIDPLIYADTFDCAATLDELWRYNRVAIDRAALELRLSRDRALRRVLIERDGLYCLADRPALLAERARGIDRAQDLERRARRVARVLCLCPFVRGLVLTGSVAARNASAGADVDMLVIVAPGRLATTFLVLGTASRLVGRRVFCPNYYASEQELAMEPRNLYVAREVAQARTLVGEPDVLTRSNPWLASVLPNAPAARDDWPAPRAVRTTMQRWLEAPLRGSLGDRLERRARRVAARRLTAHYAAAGSPVPAAVLADFAAGTGLRFHRSRIDESALRRYEARRAEIARMLDAPPGAAALDRPPPRRSNR